MQFSSSESGSIHLKVETELPSWSWIYLSGLTERRKCLLFSPKCRISIAVTIFGLSESLRLIKFLGTVRIVKGSETPSKTIDCFFLFLVHLKGAPEWWCCIHFLLHCVMRVHSLIAKFRWHCLNNHKNCNGYLLQFYLFHLLFNQFRWQVRPKEGLAPTWCFLSILEVFWIP